VTLIVGIKCAEGIVVGADGGASMGDIAGMTAMQPTKKLKIIDGRAILGVSGPVGLYQRIEGSMSKNPRQLFNHSANDIKTTLRAAVWNDILLPEFEAAKATIQLLGAQAAQSSCLSATILAHPAQNGAEICLTSFNHQFSPESATDNLPFVTVGSGSRLADPFLAFIRRIFWPDRPPTVAEGEFAVWWTLDHAIKTATGGLAEPKQIMVLERRGGAVTATELSSDQCREHGEVAGRAEIHLRGFDPARGGAPQAPPAVPPIPVPPS
jgi:hypothetical protein